MSKNCKCLGCDTQKYYDLVREQDKKSCNKTECKCNESKNSPTLKESQIISDVNPTKNKNYRLTLTDTGTNDGYFLQLSRDISIFDYSNIISEFFDIDISIDYEEDYDISVIE